MASQNQPIIISNHAATSSFTSETVLFTINFTLPANAACGDKYEINFKDNAMTQLGNCGMDLLIDVNTKNGYIEIKHAFGTEYESDAENHWHECTCGETTAPEAHSYGDDYLSDAENHWHECVCGATTAPVAHSYGDDYLSDAENHWQKCICGATTAPVAHSYGDDYLSDAENHWHECVCGATTTPEAHTPGEWTG